MISISLCMIVRNEEAVLQRCLDSVKDLVDELVIVDTGSTDRTREIAAAYTPHVYDFPWIDDFSAARNFAFDQATREYCMWLDADDLFEEKDREAFREMKERLTSEVDAVMLPYHIAFDETGKPTFSYERERIVRRGMFRWQGRVHETIPVGGQVLHERAAVCHHKIATSDNSRNLDIYERQIAQGEPLTPRDRFYYSRELLYHQRYEEAEQQLRQFLEEGKGWRENNLEACRCLALCYKQLGKEEEALRALLDSLRYDAPRAEICCDIGLWFLEQEEYAVAVFWYELALSRTQEMTNGGFILSECTGYIPCIQLCVCLDRLGRKEEAAAWNERAEQFRPGTDACRLNREYFRQQGICGKVPDESIGDSRKNRQS